MKKVLTSVVIILFLIFSYSSGSEDEKFVWKEDSKDCFCGLKFRTSKHIEQLDMTKKIVTILNCDGTYVSREDWGTSKGSEEIYRETIGMSSGNFGDFAGKWEIVDRVLDEDYVKIANPRFNLPENNELNSTLIRYTSSLGKTRYANVYLYKNQLWIGTIPYHVDINKENSYSGEDVHLYEGNLYP